MPKAFRFIYEYVKTLNDLDTINYDLIENTLLESAEELGIKLLDPKFHKFHWILESKRGTDDKAAIDPKFIHSVDSVRNISKDNSVEPQEMEMKMKSKTGKKKCIKSKKGQMKLSQLKCCPSEIVKPLYHGRGLIGEEGKYIAQINHEGLNSEYSNFSGFSKSGQGKTFGQNSIKSRTLLRYNGGKRVNDSSKRRVRKISESEYQDRKMTNNIRFN